MHTISQETVLVLPDGRLKTCEAAKYLGLSKKTLANYRCYGQGPKYIKRGKIIFYFKDELDKWIHQ